jgi:hypothetical protein
VIEIVCGECKMSFTVFLRIVENSNVDKVEEIDNVLYMNLSIPLDWSKEVF